MSHLSHLKQIKPFRKATKTLLAPHLIAEVAQSKAVSPAPRTTTFPCNSGSFDLHEHIPAFDALATFGKNSFDV